jgi:hypothetical protein
VDIPVSNTAFKVNWRRYTPVCDNSGPIAFADDDVMFEAMPMMAAKGDDAASSAEGASPAPPSGGGAGDGLASVTRVRSFFPETW